MGVFGLPRVVVHVRGLHREEILDPVPEVAGAEKGLVQDHLEINQPIPIAQALELDAEQREPGRTDSFDHPARLPNCNRMLRTHAPTIPPMMAMPVETTEAGTRMRQ